MATALAASITCSTSPWLTSLSRTPTTPCEFRLRTWLPAMPANTEWISQPAMSSASSTARWMDCTVDSMLTTTPFFRPLEGCEPTPISSMLPSAVTSPTRATTFEVPISNPMIRLRSVRLDIAGIVLILGIAVGGAAPADGEAIGVTHVDVGDIGGALRHDPGGRCDESIESFIELLTPQTYGYAVIQVQLPGTARIQAQCRDPHAHFQQAIAHREVALYDIDLGAIRSGQTRQLLQDMGGIVREQVATGIEQATVAPARGRDLLPDGHGKTAR